MTALLVLGSLALVAGVLAIPIDLRLHAVVDDGAHARFRLEWLFGWVGWNLEPRSKPGGKRQMPDWKGLSPLWQEAFRAEIMRLLRRCRRWVDVGEVRGTARVGLGDPADTGTALGMLQPLVAAIDEWPRVDLQLVPDFGEARFEGQLEAGLRAVPAGLIPPVLAFALSPETLRTVWQLRSRRR